MNGCYFCFKGIIYAKGTIVELQENHKKDFGFLSKLSFVRYNVDENMYYFKSLYNSWDEHKMTETQLNECIKEICVPQYGAQTTQMQKVDPNYIDGIVSAWIWYIVIMIFGFFLKGPINVVSTWVVASSVFFGWRRKKMKGE